MNTKFLLKNLCYSEEWSLNTKMMRNDYRLSLERKQTTGVYLLLLKDLEVFRFGGSRLKVAKDGGNLEMEISGFSFASGSSL